MTDSTSTVKVKNISGENLLVPWLNGRLVEKDQVIEVPAEEVWAYTQQAETWAPVDTAAKKATKEAAEDLEAAQAAEVQALEDRFGTTDPAPPDAPAPAGDDSFAPQED